ncbi:zinc finger protein Pegasus-like isoform X2 [Patiria miniata]|nr:zinc finger protein Pegasus-like isoform X2 [Patiria miniata]XP_038045289.1 zinc finger protein Pegasus-like isoform X2 [Patiria miniata]
MQRDAAEVPSSEECSAVRVKQEPGEGTSRQSSSESGKATSSTSCPPDDTTVISDAEDSDRDPEREDELGVNGDESPTMSDDQGDISLGCHDGPLNIQAQGDSPMQPESHMAYASQVQREDSAGSGYGFTSSTETEFAGSEEQGQDREFRDFICRLCKRTFSKKQSLRRHMNLHSGHRPFQCPFCEYRSSRKDHLQLHMRTRHDPGQSKHYVYKCPICGNSFPSQKRVLTHLKSHQTVHRCEQCDYGFPSLLAYENHKKMKHATVSCPPTTEPSSFTCPTCKYECVSAEDYNNHLQSQRHRDMITASVRVPQIHVQRRLQMGGSSASASSMESASSLERETSFESVQSGRSMPPSGLVSMPSISAEVPCTGTVPLSLVKVPTITVSPNHQRREESYEHSPSRDDNSPSQRQCIPQGRGGSANLPVISHIVSLHQNGKESATRRSPLRESRSTSGSAPKSYESYESGKSSSSFESPGFLLPKASAVSPQRSSRTPSPQGTPLLMIGGMHGRPDDSPHKRRCLSHTGSSSLESQPSSELMAGVWGSQPTPVICRDNSTQDDVWRCEFCHIIFPDNIMYAIHMGCHDLRNPLQCNICAFQCQDRYEFTSHIARGLHSKSPSGRASQY